MQDSFLLFAIHVSGGQYHLVQLRMNVSSISLMDGVFCKTVSEYIQYTVITWGPMVVEK